MNVTSVKNGDGSMDITISLDANEMKCLKNDLPGDAGVVDWYSKGPSSEKIYKCKERMMLQEGPKLRAKGIALPADDNALIDAIMADADYKDREARDAAEKA